MHLLFERAMLWELFDTQSNPIELVKIKGVSKRQNRPQTLAPEKFQEMLALLKEPHKTMAMVAMCAALRASELFALRWEHIDIKAGTMLVQQGAVNGRIGKVKTEASQDEVPLDPAFAEVLLKWKGDTKKGLVFPSPVTGGCFHAGILQRKILRPTSERIGVSRLGIHTFRQPIVRSWTRLVPRLVCSRS
jgi:integrase